MKFATIALLSVFCAFAQFPDTFLGSMSVGQNPSDVCISPDGSRAYAAVGFGFATAVDINDYSDFTLAGLVSIDGEPVTLECDPSGEYLYVADQENNIVHIINTSSLTIVKTLDIQPEPSDMVLHSAGDRIYLSHEGGMLTVINTDTQLVEEYFWAGEDMNSLCITPSEDYVIAADYGSAEETVINTSTGVLTHINSGLDSYGCTVSGDGSMLFLSCPGWDLVGVMDMATQAPQSTIYCPGGAPGKMIALPELPYVYGVCPSENRAVVFGTDDLTVKGEISITGTPANIAVHPDGERLFIVCSGDNKLKVYGFDPAGIDPIIPEQMLSILSSPSCSPSVRIKGIQAGSLYLTVYDVTGRSILETETGISLNETREFVLNELPPGMLIVTAENGGYSCSVKVIVLEP